MTGFTIAATVAQFGILATLLVASSMTDLRERRIPNKLTYGTILVALSVALLNQLFGADGAGPSLAGAVVGFATCCSIMFVAYVTIGIGAGDVKLAAAIGCLLGSYHGIETILWAHVAGGIFVVAALLWHHGAKWIVLKGCAVCLPAYFPHPVMKRELLNYPVPMAVFFAAGSLLSLSGVGIL